MNAKNGIPRPQTIIAGKATNNSQVLCSVEEQRISKSSLFRDMPSTSMQLRELYKIILLKNSKIE